MTAPGNPASPGDGRPDLPWPEIDTTVANEARVYDFLLGGTDNFQVDREAAEVHGGAVGGIENARHAVRANRRFLGRAVRYLAGEAGITQFLDIGSGIPRVQNVHEVAQEVAPAARVAYVDKDPVVLSHAHTLLSGSAEGATAYLSADMRETTRVMERAGATMDLIAPVAVLFVSMLHFLGEADDPYGLVGRYLESLAPGSFLVVSHLAADIQPEAMAALARSAEDHEPVGYQFHPRARAEVARFFEGVELVEPGLVPVEDWQPDEQPPPPPPGGGLPPFHAGVGRKP